MEIMYHEYELLSLADHKHSDLLQTVSHVEHFYYNPTRDEKHILSSPMVIRFIIHIEKAQGLREVCEFIKEK